MVQVFPDKEKASRAGAELFVKCARQAVGERGRFTVALTGGSSPDALYDLLARPPYREEVPWGQTHVFWGDERWVPLDDNRSNAKMAFDLLLSKVPIPPKQVHPMWREGVEPEDFAIQYEQLLLQHFGDGPPRFDLILLGMGDDGHTASLFPRTAVLSETVHWVRAYYLKSQSMHRITLTAPLINEGRTICFMTFGAGKAAALAKVLEGDRAPEQYPSQLIAPGEGEVHWLVDEEAASQLTRR